GFFRRRTPEPERPPAGAGWAAPQEETVGYLEVTPELRRSVIQDARESGHGELPAVDAPEPIPEPPALNNWRNVFENACHGQKKSAAARLAPVHQSLASLATQILNGVPVGVAQADNNEGLA